MLRYAAQQAVDHSGSGDRIVAPDEEILATSCLRLGGAETAVVPELPDSLPEFLEAEEVANNPVVPVVPSQLLLQLLVLLPERKVQVFAAPFRQRGNARLSRLFAVFRLTTHARPVIGPSSG